MPETSKFFDGCDPLMLVMVVFTRHIFYLLEVRRKMEVLNFIGN
jgi:hypothetical protein